VQRLVLARYWLALVTSYYVIRCVFVIFPRYDRRSAFVQAMIIIQLIGMCLVFVGMIGSYWNISMIKPLLYIQAA
jgi:hypothetical protein